MKILLTGASGCIGQNFVQYRREQYNIVPFSLRENTPMPDLSGIDAVLHLGGIAHQKTTTDEEVFEANTELTKRLALAAKAAGIKQFVYASSVKVYGDVDSESLNEYSECRPTDAYGKSKLLAELFLKEINDESFIVSIIRIPLAYGPGVKGNMKSLLQLAQTSWPLPFKNIDNKRSVVFVGNLISLFDSVLLKRSGGVFVAGDATPISTSYLVSLLRKYSGKKQNLFPIPKWMKSVVRKLHYPLYIRLFGSFCIDASATNKRLSFQPPYSTEEGIANMVKWFKTISS